MSTPKSQPAYAAPALTRGLAILQYLAGQSAPLSQSEIARALGRTSAENFRILTVLEKEGYLRRDDAGGYSLTLKLFRLGQAIDPIRTLVASARNPMRGFSDRTGQECHLSTLEEGRLLVLAQESGAGAISLRVREGSVHDPRRTSSGRLLLATLPEAEYKWHTSLARKQFPGRVPTFPPQKRRRLRSAGIYTTTNESHPGIRDCVIRVDTGPTGLRTALASSRLLSHASDDALAAEETMLRETAALIAGSR